MLNKYRNSKKTEGFTIIEVMIVLAIAGLIMLIVFLAVPALQRNSRNTQRKTDVGNVSSAATTVVANNNGSLTKLTTDALKNEVGSNLSYYQLADVSVSATAVPAAATNGTTVDTIVVYKSAKCGDMTGGQGALTGTARQIAVVYTAESGTGTTKLCVDQ